MCIRDRYISESCPHICGKASIKWQRILSKPASKTENKPTGPAPMIQISVVIILLFLNVKNISFLKKVAQR